RHDRPKMSSGVTSSPGDLVLAWVTRSGGVGSDNDFCRSSTHKQIDAMTPYWPRRTSMAAGILAGKQEWRESEKLAGKHRCITEGDLLLGTSQGVLMGTEGALGSSGGLDGYTEQEHWNRLGMLLVVSSLSALGTLGNIFAIAAVMTEEHLKKKGSLGYHVDNSGDIYVILQHRQHTQHYLHSPALAWENSARVAGRSVGVGVLVTFVGVSWAAAGAVTVTQWVTGLAPPHCASTPAPRRRPHCLHLCRGRDTSGRAAGGCTTHPRPHTVVWAWWGAAPFTRPP
ncbi:hypothetical protein Pcinc_039623, partial [Petrolisthes cinctipes]